jgi:uncharacterized alkaline shock family protein YloU
MAMSGHPDLPALPCGRLVEDLWDRLDRVAADPHTVACPHCQAASGRLTALRQLTARLAAQPVQPPGDLTGRIMAVVRAEIRRGRDLPLPTTADGPASVSEYALAAVLRFAADHVPGVRARGCRAEPVAGQPGHVRVRLGLAVGYGLPVSHVTEEVRDRVTTAANDHLALVIDSLDIDVEDVYPEGGGR